MKKRCYTYIRVSTEKQIEGFSLESQRDRLKKEAAARNFHIVHEYRDEGKSGKTIAGRKDFQEMISRIKGGNPDKVEYILVFKLSRFGRNARDVLNSLKAIQKQGVQLRTAEEGIDSGGPYGNLMLTIMAAVAEVERENISAQTMAGRYEKAREGLWNGGQAPFGYKINSETGILEINEEEAEIVRIIFEQFVYHELGVNGVARYLENNGYRKEIRGNGKYALFSAHTVKTILDNEVYTGKIVYGRRKIEHIESEDGEEVYTRRINNEEYGVYEGKHKPIIDADLWELAHEKRIKTGTKREKTHSLEHEYLLTGLLKCPKCGAPMYGNVNRKLKKDGSGEHYKDAFYYVCKHRKLIDGQKCSYKRQPPEKAVNAEVIAIIRQAMKSPDLVRLMRDYTNAQTDGAELQKRLDEVEKTRRQKVTMKDRISVDLDSIDLSDETAEMEYADLKARQKKIYEEIIVIDREIRDIKGNMKHQADSKATLKTARRLMEEAGEKLLADDIEDIGKKLMLQCMIEHVDLYEEKTNGRYVKGITFNFPVMLDGEITEQWWDKGNPVETVVLMERQFGVKDIVG